MSEDILVIGSMNMDLLVKTDRIPQKGETLIGDEFHMVPGGKGANQASTIGKLGGNVAFISACGHDYFADILLASLEDKNVDISGVEKLGDSTGVASITIEKDGNNRIIVVPGANGKITPDIIDKYEERIAKSSVILLQLEIPLESVIYTIDLANKYETKVILDPAPAQTLPEGLYKKIDYILPNEGELSMITSSYNLDNQKEKIEKLLDLGMESVIVKLGANGVCYYQDDCMEKYSAIDIDAVDTTAAGDVFAGAFAIGLDKDWSVDKSIRYANIVAGLSTTKLGAQSSIPSKKEVEDYINKRRIKI